MTRLTIAGPLKAKVESDISCPNPVNVAPRNQIANIILSIITPYGKMSQKTLDNAYRSFVTDKTCNLL